MVKIRPLVAITQRVDSLPDRGEKRDGLDQRWHALAAAAGIDLLCLPNGEFGYLERFSLAGIILSGGNNLSPDFVTENGTPPLGLPAGLTDAYPERDRLESFLLAMAKQKQLPALGVCRGMQAANAFFGGKLTKVQDHVRTRHVLIREPGAGIELPTEVNSYHELGIRRADLGSGLLPLVCAPDGTVEAFKHEELPIFGVMWHPEREHTFTAPDLALLHDLFVGRKY